MQEFTLKDAQGQEHQYLCIPHKTSDGTKLCNRILAIAGEPLGRVLSSNLVTLIEMFQQGKIDVDSDADQLIGVLKDLDIDLGSIVGDIARAVALAGDDKFFKELLKHTTRDGKQLTDPANYEPAYQANYAEQLQAVAKVIMINGFIPFLGAFSQIASA